MHQVVGVILCVSNGDFKPGLSFHLNHETVRKKRVLERGSCFEEQTLCFVQTVFVARLKHCISQCR